VSPLGPGDVRFFDAVARPYDALMPATDARALGAALGFARRPVERVLDLGGGTGRASRALARMGCDPLVADASAGMLARARDRGFDCVRADAGRLPVRDGGVDAVVVVDAFHHLPDQRAALAEAARVVAPGGVVVIREFDPGTVRGRALVAAERVARMRSTFRGPDDLARAMADVGLDARLLDTGFEFTVYGLASGGTE
jgi:demethylmenaquinone methyltransferase/2-methoxy-6-polyprenyl-1,4-benzoquinol methylase